MRPGVTLSGLAQDSPEAFMRLRCAPRRQPLRLASRLTEDLAQPREVCRQMARQLTGAGCQVDIGFVRRDDIVVARLPGRVTHMVYGSLR